MLAAEHGLGELEVGHDLEVGAARRPRRPRRPPPPNGLPPKKASNMSPRPPNPPNGSARRPPFDALGAERVVATALLGVGQHLVGVGDLLEPGLGLGVAVPGVGVELAGEPAEGALDLVRRGGAGDAEQLVVVGGRCHRFRFLSPR